MLAQLLFLLVLTCVLARSASFCLILCNYVRASPEGLRKSVWICLDLSDLSGFVWMSGYPTVWMSGYPCGFVWICLDLSGYVCVNTSPWCVNTSP